MIGVLSLEAVIYEAGSLKEKRSVTKSVADRVRRKFNVSFAEVDHQEVWQRVKWVAVTVSGDKQAAERELQAVLSFIDSFPSLDPSRIEWEWL
ncbi:DUF503 domain-containing protein [Alkalicoccus halolimnae]|uniref:DUF503 domain-containing protein n=1 Tax=Alkalicoccus halolimnae TaxID=1667239 RepID=A0AAJ8N3D8_9BACI|nr:DUF503 domain-containing protein [Alkalicoccus halolimnae]